MIKAIILCFLITTVYAGDDKTASAIFNMITKSITKKSHATVYLHTQVNALEKHPGNLQIIKDCKKADLLIVSTMDKIPKECQQKIIFGTRYSHLKNSNVVGAFFWQKGRPNILFYEKRLKKKNIKLAPSFEKYIEK